MSDNDEMTKDVEDLFRTVTTHWETTTPAPPPFPVADDLAGDAEAPTPLRRPNPLTRPPIQWLAAAAAVVFVVVGVMQLTVLNDEPEQVATTVTTESEETDAPVPTAAATGQPAPTAGPVESPTALLAIEEPPSQSGAHAARDGVHPLVAALTFDERVEVVQAIVVDGETWAISRFPDETRDWIIAEQLPLTAGILPGDGELVRIEDGRIIRAIPMEGFPPTNILADDRYVIGFRVGDGGSPDSGFVRFDRVTETAKRFMIPWQFGREPFATHPGWPVPIPPQAAVAREVFQTSDSATRMNLLNQVFDTFEAVDPGEWPPIHEGCPHDFFDVGGSGVALEGQWSYLQAGSLCAVSITDFGEEPLEFTTLLAARNDTADALEVPGRVVGIHLLPASETEQFVVATVDHSGQQTPDPALQFFWLGIDTDMGPGLRFTSASTEHLLDEGSAASIEKISFFDATSYVVTRRTEDGASVAAYGSSGGETEEMGEMEEVILPVDFGSGAHPREATITDDGTLIAWLEAGIRGEVVVASTATGETVSRSPIDREVATYATLDFDGRWALVGTKQLSEASHFSYLLDTSNGYRYPQDQSYSTNLVE